MVRQGSKVVARDNCEGNVQSVMCRSCYDGVTGLFLRRLGGKFMPLLIVAYQTARDVAISALIILECSHLFEICRHFVPASYGKTSMYKTLEQEKGHEHMFKHP